MTNNKPIIGKPISDRSSESAPARESSPLPKPVKHPKPDPILEYGEMKAGDSITLPYSGKQVTVTEFYQSPSENWYAAFEDGCVRIQSLRQKDSGEA